MAMVAVLRILNKLEKTLVLARRWGNCRVYSGLCLLCNLKGYACMSMCVCVCVCVRVYGCVYAYEWRVCMSVCVCVNESGGRVRFRYTLQTFYMRQTPFQGE